MSKKIKNFNFPESSSYHDIAVSVYNFHKDEVAYDGECWYVFEDGLWMADLEMIRFELLLMKNFYDHCSNIENSISKLKKSISIIKKLVAIHDRKEIISEAKELFYRENFSSLLDINSNVIAINSGDVLELKDKRICIRQAEPSDYCSIRIDFSYNDEYDFPEMLKLFKSFLFLRKVSLERKSLPPSQIVSVEKVSLDAFSGSS